MEPIKVDMHEAKTQLSRLFRSGLEGREVINCQWQKPVLRLGVLLGDRRKTKAVHGKMSILSMSEDFKD